MNKMNKKGFTLIEMLVVIAIIAILVSIIIPAVGSSTKRAAAATDAANLRSAKAVISIMLLDGETFEDGVPTAAECGIPATGKYEGGQFAVEPNADGVNFTVKYGEKTISQLADIADNGKEDGSSGAVGS